MNEDEINSLEDQLKEKFDNWNKVRKRRSLKKLREDTIEWHKETRRINNLEADNDENINQDLRNLFGKIRCMKEVLFFSYSVEMEYSLRLEKELAKYKSKTRKKTRKK